MKRSIRATFLAAALTLASGAPAFASLRIASGETMHATPSTPDINTKNAQVGQPVTLQLAAPYPGGVISGHISEVRTLRALTAVLAFASSAGRHTSSVSDCLFPHGF